MNNLIISGVLTPPVYSHTILGTPYYSSTITSERSSGTLDTIPLITTLSELPEKATIKGQLRTRNEDRHLRTFIFPEEFLPYVEPVNQVTLEGYICKTPIYRKTPLGRTITNLLIAVHRPYAQSDYIPCIAWWDETQLKIGDKVKAIGRIQSRNYTKGVTYELSLTNIEIWDKIQEEI